MSGLDRGSGAQLLAVSMGDPAGIGIDIALSAWVARAMHRIPPFVFFADPATVAARSDALGLDVAIKEIDHPAKAIGAWASALPIVPIAVSERVVAGQPSSSNANNVIEAIAASVSALYREDVTAVVTNPISKRVLHAAGFAYPGHTEYLGELAREHDPEFRGEPVMMLVAPQLRVVPVTIHIPLCDVPGSINSEMIVSVGRCVHEALLRDFGLTDPTIAVAGLNPHAGEEGGIGLEERDIIVPAIETLCGQGLKITGPHPADTLFAAHVRPTFDAAICMYHDQALIPLKALAFDEGVNVTLGLPFVRTSPDHGTAFELAGTGRASPKSFVAALKLASEIAVRRAAVRAT